MSGKITEEEIERLAEEREKEEKDSNPDILKVLEGLRAGKTCVEIASDVSFGNTRVIKVKKQLIEER